MCLLVITYKKGQGKQLTMEARKMLESMRELFCQYTYKKN